MYETINSGVQNFICSRTTQEPHIFALRGFCLDQIQHIFVGEFECELLHGQLNASYSGPVPSGIIIEDQDHGVNFISIGQLILCSISPIQMTNFSTRRFQLVWHEKIVSTNITVQFPGMILSSCAFFCR